MRPIHFDTRIAPRAVAGGVRAATDPVAVVAEIRAILDGRLKNAEDAIDKLLAGGAAAALGGSSIVVAPDPEYSTAFASYFRKGGEEAAIREANATGERAKVQAAMSVGTADAGGYLAPVEWDRKIAQALYAFSPMRRLATVQTTTVGAYSTIWSDRVWGSGWVGETASRPETTTPGLDPVEFAAGEIYANPAITQRLLDDAQFNVEQWLADQVDAEFSAQESLAFITGNGTNKPRGLLTYITGGASAGVHPGGNLTTVNSGHATTLNGTDTLVTFAYSLPAPYRQNATWLMNSNTAAAIALMKDGQGNYIWRESLIVGQPATLLGRPVEIDENMPNVGAGTYPIAFGDFKRGYLINDRTGSRVLRDPYTSKPFVLFYVTKRVGGGVADPTAIRLLKISA